jgi:hypothetical protein
MNERRRAERLPMTIPIELGNISGVTQDFSGIGVFFTLAEPLDAGSEIAFVLRVPDAVNVRCRGHIVRVNGMAGQYGIAATIDDYECDESPGDGRGDAHIIIEELRRHHAS